MLNTTIYFTVGELINTVWPVENLRIPVIELPLLPTAAWAATAFNILATYVTFVTIMTGPFNSLLTKSQRLLTSLDLHLPSYVRGQCHQITWQLSWSMCAGISTLQVTVSIWHKLKTNTMRNVLPVTDIICGHELSWHDSLWYLTWIDYDTVMSVLLCRNRLLFVSQSVISLTKYRM